MKVTPILETGITLDYLPEKHPISKPCHVHLRWAEQKCPICQSALMIYYCPIAKHEAGFEAASPEERHKIVVSCINCSFISIT
jgi:hypothetical protein